MTELTLRELTAQLCELEVRLELRIGDVPAAQIIRAACRRLELQRRALEPFRHMRIQFDERPAADCEITNLIDGVLCTVGYARSSKEANEFDEIFERARSVL